MIDERTSNIIDMILNHSSLSQEDRSLWKEKLFSASPLQASLFISLFSENSPLLPLITSNLKKKISASQSKESLDGIFQEERLLLQGALKN